MYEYKSGVVEIAKLQDKLTAMGANGWRLHTCEFTPVQPKGMELRSEMLVMIVMERILPEEVNPAAEAKATGMECT